MPCNFLEVDYNTKAVCQQLSLCDLLLFAVAVHPAAFASKCHYIYIYMHAR